MVYQSRTEKLNHTRNEHVQILVASEGSRKTQKSHVITYWEAAGDLAGPSFWVRVSWYHPTGGDHGHWSFAAHLTHLQGNIYPTGEKNTLRHSLLHYVHNRYILYI